MPGPAETLLVPLGLAEPHRVWRFAGAATLGSFAGALVSFAIGEFAFYSLGLPMLGLFGFDIVDVERSRALFADHGLLLVALSTITPLSLKLTSMAAGAFGIPVGRFALLVLVGRTVRFLIVAAVVYYAGERLSHWLARRDVSLRDP
jgi:membrane protein YqaA with SNARE-associated domain